MQTREVTKKADSVARGPGTHRCVHHNNKKGSRLLFVMAWQNPPEPSLGEKDAHDTVSSKARRLPFWPRCPSQS